jgi:hypothetical protein
MVRRDYRLYINSILDDIKSNPKRFWSLVNSRRKSQRIPLELHLNELKASGGERPELFSTFFYDNFAKQSNGIIPPPPPLRQVTNHFLSTINTTPAEVFQIINDIPEARGAGSDEIPAIFVKKCVFVLCYPFSIILNRCFKEGCFPSVWKLANIVPILKSGDKCDIKNYRPISMLPILSIIYEKILYNRLLTFVSPYLSEAQHGFLARKSCLTNLAVIQTAAIKAINTKFQLDVIHIDFEKAFDRVDHNLLLHKLHVRFGITGDMLCVLSDFLHNRKQRVVVGGDTSDWCNVLSGIAQGSTLGPLLFVLFIDDLPEYLSIYDVDILLFADDSKLFKLIKTVRDAIALQRALHTLMHWCKVWKLHPNVKKCGVISFTWKDLPINFEYSMLSCKLQRLQNVNDLGVIFDPKLLFVDHINSIRSKAMQMLGIIYRFTDIRDADALKLYFTSCVLPKLEYCSPIWSTAADSNLKLLDRVTSFFCHIVRNRVFNLRDSSNSQILSALNLTKLHLRRQRGDLIFLHKIFHGKVSTDFLVSNLTLHVPCRVTRQTNLFFIPHSRINIVQRSLFTRLPSLYNALPNHIDITYSMSHFYSLFINELPIAY